MYLIKVVIISHMMTPCLSVFKPMLPLYFLGTPPPMPYIKDGTLCSLTTQYLPSRVHVVLDVSKWELQIVIELKVRLHSIVKPIMPPPTCGVTRSLGVCRAHTFVGARQIDASRRALTIIFSFIALVHVHACVAA